MLAVEQILKIWPSPRAMRSGSRGRGHVVGTEQVHGQHLAQLRAIGGLVLQAAGQECSGIIHQHFDGVAQGQYEGGKARAVLSPAQVGR